ncbi:MAG: HDOD domain-containing protein [Gammaproteobacteria bacterium]|nr:HDOD domain-containing protein [Gammaproteobacteria bacterium]
MRVAIANSNRAEQQVIGSTLQEMHETRVISADDKINEIIEYSDFIIIDANYSSDQGINLLMNVESESHLPVLMVVPMEDQRCAVEAMRSGAQNFLVKSDDYHNLLPAVVEESYKQFNKVEELKRTICELKEQVQAMDSGESGKSEQTGQVKEGSDSRDSVRKKIMEQIIKRLKKGDINLPSYANINDELSELMDGDASMLEISKLLQKDASVTSKLISVANSPMNRGVSDASTVEQAINRLGLVSTKNYVEVITNRSLYTYNNKRFEPLLDQLFQHSLATAYAASSIEKTLGNKDKGQIFTLGMLHDVGMLFLIQILSELVVEDESLEDLSDEQVDEFLFEHHAQFGTVLLKRWKLPLDFIEIVQNHEKVEEVEPPSQTLCIINCADLLAQKMGYGCDYHVHEDISNAFSTQYLSLDKTHLNNIEKEVKSLMSDTTF